MSDITVIILSRDRLAFLKQAVNSALNQSIAPFDIIVSDNSTTCEVSDYYAVANSAVSFIRQSGNLSPQEHIVVAATSARSRYVTFLHDDDILEPEYLSNMSRVFKLYPNVGAVGTNASNVDVAGNMIGDIPNTIFRAELIRFSSEIDLYRAYGLRVEGGVGAFSSFCYNVKKVDFSILFKCKTFNYWDSIFLGKLASSVEIIVMSERLIKIRHHDNRISSRCSVRDYKMFFKYAISIASDREQTLPLRHYRLYRFYAEFIKTSRIKMLSRGGRLFLSKVVIEAITSAPFRYVCFDFLRRRSRFCGK
jgi:glycosyltransferase involved in cell wall biosynthesis